MASRPTIRDVAKEAGFSISTVSMVLNNKGMGIPPKTREKVIQTAHQLGYRPNKLAVSLLTKRTMMLGLIIPDNSSLFYASLSKVIETEAKKAGYSLIYGNSDNNAQNDLSYIDMFMDRQVDGLILAVSPFATEEEEQLICSRLEQATVPIVMVDRFTRGSNLPVLQMNHYDSGRLIANHLIKQGHRRIGVFVTPGIISARSQKLEGYRDAFIDNGLDPDEGLFSLSIGVNRQIESEIFKRILDLGLTAVQAISDSTAVELYRLAEQEGIFIPEELSVVGSDDLFFSDMLTPPLTTVRQPVPAVAAATIKTMLALIHKTEKTSINKMQQFEPQLIVRGSTAPPLGISQEEKE